MCHESSCHKSCVMCHHDQYLGGYHCCAQFRCKQGGYCDFTVIRNGGYNLTRFKSSIKFLFAILALFTRHLEQETLGSHLMDGKMEKLRLLKMLAPGPAIAHVG